MSRYESSRRNRPQRNWVGTVAGIGYVGLLCVALGAGLFLGWSSRSGVIGSFLFDHRKPEEVFSQHTLTVLVLGCDEDLSKGGKRVLRKQARSDMMLLARFDFDNQRITGVSIPRDTECQVPGYKLQKINAYHSIAKPGEEAELTKTAVETLLPVKVDRVVTLDFDAFQQMINDVDGVTVDVKKRMHYTDKAGKLYIDFHPGVQHLNGYNAMCYVRFRHGDSDFAREERQREFMLDFKKQALSHLISAPEVLNDAVAALGNTLSDSEVASLGKFVQKIGPERILLGQIPVVDAAGTDLRVDDSKLRSVLEQYDLIDRSTERVSYRR